MKKLFCLIPFLLSAAVYGQTTFDIKDASKFFDVRVKVATCENGFCHGKATVSLFKKGGTTPYQVINLPDTQIQLNDDGTPSVNVTMLYDQQSVVNVEDFNFDGMEDIALCNGSAGSYGMPSYSVYLSSRSAGKFVYSPAFSRLASHLGMFNVNKDKKQLETFDKSGCCWHVLERYSVVRDRPVKIFEEIQDATIGDQKRVKITTKTLVGGRWKRVVRYVPREE
jgi:hypothetical protein